MGKLIFLLLILYLSLSTGILSAGSYPVPFSSTYQGGKYLIFSAESIISLERYNDYYKYSMTTEGSVLFYTRRIYDCSVMRIDDDNIYPVEHKHHDEGDKKYSSHTIFNWDTRQASTAFGDGRNKSTTLETFPTWDPMSIHIKVMLDLIKDQFTTINTYKLIENASLSDQSIKYAGEELVVSPHYSLQGHKVESVTGDANKLWYSSDYHYLPIKMEISGVTVELVSEPSTSRQPAKQVVENFIPKC
jgi:hypothetical protein